mmetsp:Transcript_11113/g.21716  ORF Transcript_11113/g.21716 Transcript_11113/m.21716 type:complete len:195 (-) Transcript_11113:138-722(-)
MSIDEDEMSRSDVRNLEGLESMGDAEHCLVIAHIEFFFFVFPGVSPSFVAVEGPHKFATISSYSSSSSSSSSSAGASPGNDSSSHRSHRRDDSGEGHGGTGASLYSQALQDNTGRTGEGSNDIIDANRRVSAGADLGWEVGHPSSLFYWSPRGVDRRPSDLIIVKKRTNSTPVTRTTELTASGKTHVHTYAQGR